MRYRVLVRRYETVVRDVWVEVQESGKRRAEDRAVELARVMDDSSFSAVASGQDLRYEAVRVDYSKGGK